MWKTEDKKIILYKYLNVHPCDYSLMIFSSNVDRSRQRICENAHIFFISDENTGFVLADEESAWEK